MVRRACQGVRVCCLRADPRSILGRKMQGFDKWQCSKPDTLQKEALCNRIMLNVSVKLRRESTPPNIVYTEY